MSAGFQMSLVNKVTGREIGEKEKGKRQRNNLPSLPLPKLLHHLWPSSSSKWGPPLFPLVLGDLGTLWLWKHSCLLCSVYRWQSLRVTANFKFILLPCWVNSSFIKDNHFNKFLVSSLYCDCHYIYFIPLKSYPFFKIHLKYFSCKN